MSAEKPTTGSHYYAFISYSHRDRVWAKWLHRALETYALPRDLIPRTSFPGDPPTRLFPVFRDYEELPTSSDLGANIRSALEASRFLIVICSPDSAHSRWVGEEIETFKRLGRADRILPIIVAGEPNARFKPDADQRSECFHEALQWKYDGKGRRTDRRSEPIASDARQGQGGRNTAFLKIVAGLTGIEFAALDRRDARRRTRRRRTIAAVATLLFCAALSLSAVAITNWREAQIQRKEARDQQERADSQQRLAASRRAELYAREAERWHTVESDPTRALFYYVKAARECQASEIDGNLYSLQIQRLTRQMPRAVLFQESTSRAAEFNPDGTRVLTASLDGVAQLWNATTGEPVGEPLLHEAEIFSAVFSPDGKTILTTSGDRLQTGKANMWDANTGELLSLDLKTDLIVSMAVFSPNGKLIATRLAEPGRLSHDVQVWNPATGEPVGEVMNHVGCFINSIQFNKDSSQIVTAFDDHQLKEGHARVWDASTGKPVSDWMKHELFMCAAEFSPDGKRILTAMGPEARRSGAGMAQLWDAATGNPLETRFQHEFGVASAHFSPNGRWVATASWDNTARIWNSEVSVAAGDPLEHESWVHSASFSPDGMYLVTASGTYNLDDEDGPGWAQVFEVPDGRPVSKPIKHEEMVRSASFDAGGNRFLTLSWGRVRVWDRDPEQPVNIPFGPKDLLVHFAAFSHDGESFISIDRTKIQRWDTRSGAAVGPPIQNENFITEAALSPDDRRIVAAVGDGTVEIWDTATGKRVGPQLEDSKQSVNSLSYSPNGDRILAICSGSAFSGLNSAARIWDADSGRLVGQPMDHSEPVHSAAWSPDGRQIVTASGDETAIVWEAATGTPVLPPLEHEQPVLSASFSQDGKWIVTSTAERSTLLDWEGQARIWEASTGKMISTSRKHEGSVPVAVISPDGTRFATASSDHTARVWDTNTGEPVTNPLPHDGFVSSIQFSPDGKWVLTASSDDGTAHVWETETGHAVGAPMSHGPFLDTASFSPDGKRIFTVSRNTVKIWQFGSVVETIPDWMLDTGEALSGLRLTDAESLEPIPAAELIQLRREWFERLSTAASTGDEAAQFVIQRWYPAPAGPWAKPQATVDHPPLIGE